MKKYILPSVFLLLTACSTYQTPVYNDPLFNLESTDISPLQKEAEPYAQRTDATKNMDPFSPRENEPFEHFTQRLANTLAAQEYELDVLRGKIQRKRKSIHNLNEQIPVLQKRHVDLRLSLMRVTSDDALSGKQGKVLFKRHIVSNGETLQKIAYQNYRTYTGWLAIYRFNRDQLPHGPNRIQPGQILYLPNIKDED